MLQSLSIQNVVLIQSLTLDFSDGLNVLTGETGAGKSILLDSLALALGARSDAALIRHGQSSLSVAATFLLPSGHEAFSLLREQGIETDETVILRRVVYADGRSKAFVNDQPVGVTFLKQIGSLFIEIHGQFAVTGLLNPATHLGILDAYGRLGEVVGNCRKAWQTWQSALKEREAAQEAVLKARADEAYVRDSLADLEKLNPRAGEEADLSQQRHSLMNGEKIAEALSEAVQLLTAAEHGGGALLLKAAARLEKADALAQGRFDTALRALDEARDAVESAVQEIEAQGADITDTGRLPEIDERLFALKAAARKHGVTPDELPAVMTELQSRLNTLETGEERLEILTRQEKEACQTYREVAADLSLKRRAAAHRLDAGVTAELPALKLAGARFETHLTEKNMADASAEGLDTAVFMVATNKGSALAPLHKAASGGELSRFMLALKVNLAALVNQGSIVFDEVDSGIGGATAEAVGHRLARLGKLCQVLVVTHSPQVAGFGKTHFCVSKHETKEAVLTHVEPLNHDQRIAEVARMLSGGTVSESALAVAAELVRVS